MKDEPELVRLPNVGGLGERAKGKGRLIGMGREDEPRDRGKRRAHSRLDTRVTVGSVWDRWADSRCFSSCALGRLSASLESATAFSCCAVPCSHSMRHDCCRKQVLVEVTWRWCREY
jgi:hypothetical protein